LTLDLTSSGFQLHLAMAVLVRTDLIVQNQAHAKKPRKME